MNDQSSKFSVLFVDDDSAFLSYLRRTFIDEDYHLHLAPSGHDALAILGKVRVDAAFVDLKMPEMDGLTLLKEIRRNWPVVMIIILTGHGGVREAVEAIKLGAVDFLQKPFLSEALQARVAQLCRIWELKEENRRLRAKIEYQFGFDRLVGNSTAMLKLKELICQVGPSEESVVIEGETGTGKELVARAIHYHSPRSANNFVPVDCAAISETVIESELFGHVKGAFTGAYVSTLGLIRSANKGTLLLDEVAELSRAIQAKLLRTVQEKEVRPVGSDKSYQVDVRILAATRNLVNEVAEGRFREDLYYRLNVVTIAVPPLRERKEDIPLLSRHFVKQFRGEFSPVKDISPEALLCLENYDWPGNVRELENVIRQAMALGKEDVIRPEELPPNIYPSSVQSSPNSSVSSDDSLAAYEKLAIQNALAKCNNNRRMAAEILGIGEATLYRKMKKYQVEA